MKRIYAILLALFMLASNIGLTMNTHYCGGHAVDSSFSLGLANLDCGMPDMEKACGSEKPEAPSIQPLPCCENQHQVLEVDDNLKVFAPIVKLNPSFLFAFVFVYSQPELFVNALSNAYREYSAPLPDIDHQVMFASFLI